MNLLAPIACDRPWADPYAGEARLERAADDWMDSYDARAKQWRAAIDECAAKLKAIRFDDLRPCHGYDARDALAVLADLAEPVPDAEVEEMGWERARCGGAL